MHEILKALWNRKLNFDEQNEKKHVASKQLSKEYDELFGELTNTLNSNQLELFELILEKEGEIEAVKDEYKFIRFVTFGAQLLHELIGDISKTGNVPSFCVCDESDIIRGLYNNECHFSETIKSNSEEFRQAFHNSEAIANKLKCSVPQELWDKIEELIDSIERYYSIHESDVFAYAFKIGAQAMMEITEFRR